MPCCWAAQPAPIADRPAAGDGFDRDEGLSDAAARAVSLRPPRSRGLANQVLHINDEAVRLVALARGDAEPDLAIVRSAWQMFVRSHRPGRGRRLAPVALGRADAAPRHSRRR